MSSTHLNLKCCMGSILVNMTLVIAMPTTSSVHILPDHGRITPIPYGRIGAWSFLCIWGGTSGYMITHINLGKDHEGATPTKNWLGMTLGKLSIV